VNDFFSSMKEFVHPLVEKKAEQAGNLNKTAAEAEARAIGKQKRPTSTGDENPLKKQRVFPFSSVSLVSFLFSFISLCVSFRRSPSFTANFLSCFSTFSFAGRHSSFTLFAFKQRRRVFF
jgi:hypothetical protein